MKTITTQQIESISNYLLNSALPSIDVQKIVALLKGLPSVEQPVSPEVTPTS